MSTASSGSTVRGTETGHLADDGHQAPGARELSLTIFNGKECKQTIKSQDHGFRGDTGSTGSSSKDPGQDESDISPVQSISPKISQSPPQRLVQPLTPSHWLNIPLSKCRGQASRPPGQNVTSG